MKKRFYRILINLMVGMAFTASTILSMLGHPIWSLLCFIGSYMLLDLHTYLSNKYNLNPF